MSFILGLLVGLGLSSKGNRPNVGGIWFDPVGDHSTDPFAAQDIAFQQSFAPDSSKAGDLSLPDTVKSESNLPAEGG